MSCVDADGGTRFLCLARPLQRDAKSVSATTMTKLQESIKLAHGNLRHPPLAIGSMVILDVKKGEMRVYYTQSPCRIIVRFLQYILQRLFRCFGRVLVASKKFKVGATT